jgi:hypothetical protein
MASVMTLIPLGKVVVRMSRSVTGDVLVMTDWVDDKSDDLLRLYHFQRQSGYPADCVLK